MSQVGSIKSFWIVLSICGQRYKQFASVTYNHKIQLIRLEKTLYGKWTQ
jgi:hypothetical protein